MTGHDFGFHAARQQVLCQIMDSHHLFHTFTIYSRLRVYCVILAHVVE